MPIIEGRINRQIDQRRVLKSLFTSIAQRPLLCLALMLFWTWLNLAYQGPFFFPTIELDSGYAFTTWFAPIAASALAYFILGVWFRRTNRVIKKRWYIILVPALMMLGAILCLLWINVSGASLSSIGDISLYIMGSIFIGTGTALLMVEWGRIFGYLGPQEVLYHGIVGMLGSALLASFCSLLPALVGQIIFVIIPIPLALCLYHTLRNLPNKTLYNHGLDAELKVPYKFLVTAFLHGLSLGVFMGGLIYLGGQVNASFLAALSFAVAALLLLFTAVFFKMDFNHLIYQMGFGMMATGSFLLACIGNIPAFGMFFQLIGFCYVHLIIWGLCSYLIKNFKLPATWVIAWPTCSAMLGELIGGATSSVLVQQPDSAFWVQIMATTMVFVLLMASLFMFSNRNQSTGWGIARPANLVQSSDSVEAIIERLIVEYGTTRRESEVLALMARGRNRCVISEELFISEETAKSHINGVYRKLGIHSQQQLLDMIENAQADS